MSPGKAARYIDQLYAARCNAQWQAIPELVRKVEKHAPTRKCLALASKFGASLQLDPRNFLNSPSANQYADALSLAIEGEKQESWEAFDAAICEASVLATTARPQKALETLDRHSGRLLASSVQFQNNQNIWAAVCMVNAAALRGSIFESLHDRVSASHTYTNLFPFVSEVLPQASRSREFVRSIEEFLDRSCTYLSKGNNLLPTVVAFRLLSRFESTTRSKIHKRYIWKAYHRNLSALISQGLVLRSSGTHDISAESLEHRHRMNIVERTALSFQQFKELKQVEASYERLLLQETRFPKAGELNEEVKSWVEMFMGNWRVICGPQWIDEDLGDLGKRESGRHTVDMLYRAATKTFHSTQLLRHLFTVHSFLGEFDLAFKAFDSYVEIITKGKARVEKTGEASLELDNDEVAIFLAAEAIRVSCRYGSLEAAEKALEIGATLQKWLKKGDAKTHDHEILDGIIDDMTEDATDQNAVDTRLSPSTLASGYLAIGISQAQWSRFTYDIQQREVLQQEAIKSLKECIECNPEKSENVDALFALAVILAETKDIDGAIEAAKSALRPPAGSTILTSPDDAVSEAAEARDSRTQLTFFLRERKLITVWHLLSLLLTTRDEFDRAEASCEAAFSQFKDPETLFGSDGQPGKDIGHSSRKLSTTLWNEKNTLPSSTGIVDRMGSLEKQCVLEIKMTEMRLLEIDQGPEVAVNSSHELLALYARLFGTPLNTDRQPLRTDTAVSTNSPKSSHSTVRSRFGRQISMRKALHKSVAPQPHGLASRVDGASESRPATNSTSAPAIQVTNEDGATTGIANGVSHNSEKGQHDQNGIQSPSPSLRRSASGKLIKLRDGSRSRPATAQSNQSDSPDIGSFRNVAARNSSDASDDYQGSSDVSKISRHAPNWPLGPGQRDNTGHGVNGITRSIHPENPLSPPSQFVQSPEHDARFLAQPIGVAPFLLEPQSVGLQVSRHATSVLIKVWLFVADLYSRASMFEDGKEAVEEARRLLTALETEIAQVNSSVKAFQEHAWGTTRSLEDLWGDLYSTRGNLLVAEMLPHEAMLDFERALSSSSDHPEAIIGLSKILLDIYCQITPPEKPDPSFDIFTNKPVTTPTSNELNSDIQQMSLVSPRRADPSPPELNRLAARDRACGLLSSLTSLGTGWDNSEAWLVMARAYEESGQIERAREAFWWTVELEDTKPVRHWRNVNPGGYVL